MSKTSVHSWSILHLVVCLVLSNHYLFLVASQSWSSELETLQKIKQDWGNQGPLQWRNMSTSTSSCTAWPGIRCSADSSVTGISLGSQGITGQIPTSICNLKNLTLIDLNNNSIGGAFPSMLYNCSNLQILDLSHNLFAGNLPSNIPNLLPNTLQHLNLDTNSFSGDIPPGLWSLTRISTLILSNNYLSGQLPAQLAPTMTQLKINNNKLSGAIPPTVGSYWGSLEVLEASNNSLSGSIPFQFTNLSRLHTLCLDGNNLSGELPWPIISWINLNTLKLSKNQLSGSIPLALASLPALNLLDLSRNQLSGQVPRQLGLLYQFSLNLSSNKFTGPIPYGYDNVAYMASFLDTGLCSTSISSGIPRCSIHGESARTLPLKYYILAIVVGMVVTTASAYFSLSMLLGLRRKHTQSDDLASFQLTTFQSLPFTKRRIINNLADTNPIGIGGSGKVYRIPVDGSGGVVAVKRILSTKKANEKQFQAEVEILSQAKHVNIVKLLCCISSDDSKLLVYEYMENRSLDKWIHKGKQWPISSKLKGQRGVIYSGILDWPTRLTIAVGAAQGLSYMHHDCSPPIIHRDIKSSNILLDSEFNAKIGDFGLAKLFTKPGREPQTVSAVVGTFGYMDPEYQRLIKVSLSSDVYSFGVVLLEIVTGKGPREGEDEYTNLAEWAWKHYHQEHPISEALDIEIKKDCYLEEMIHVFNLGLACTNNLPSCRPSMKEVSDKLRMVLNHNTHFRLYGYPTPASDPLPGAQIDVYGAHNVNGDHHIVRQQMEEIGNMSDA